MCVPCVPLRCWITDRQWSCFRALLGSSHLCRKPLSPVIAQRTHDAKITSIRHRDTDVIIASRARSALGDSGNPGPGITNLGTKRDLKVKPRQHLICCGTDLMNYSPVLTFASRPKLIDLRSAQVYCVAIFLTCWHPSHFTISFLL